MSGEMSDEPSTEVLIASEDPGMRALATALYAEGIASRTVSSPEEAQRFAERAARYVALLDTDLPADVASEIYRLLHDAQAVPTLVLVPASGYQTFAVDPNRPVLDEYVVKPAQADELALRLRALMLRAGYPVPSPPMPDALAPALDAEDETRNGKLVAVFSAKGGVGKSTIAVNVAVGLAQSYAARVLLVDADLWFGDLGVLMNLTTSQSLFDAWTGDEIDLLRLSRVPVAHESGVGVLLRPPDPLMAEKLPALMITKAVATLRELYDYIIVDTRSALDELTLQVLDAADRILLVTTPEVTAGHNTARFLKIADAVGYTHKIALILNRANSGVRGELLEQHLEMQVAASVVSAGRLAVDSANQGRPLLLDDTEGREEIARNLARVVELVAGEARQPAAVPHRPSASFLKGRGQLSGLAFWRGGGR